MKRIAGLSFLFFISITGFSQSSTPVHQALEFIKASQKTWNLNDADVSGLQISDRHLSKHNGATHLYFQQTIGDIPIHNAITSVTISLEGKVYNVGHGFISNASKRTIPVFFEMDEIKAITLAATHVGIPNPRNIISRKNSRSIDKIFTAPFSDSDIVVEKVYVEDDHGKLRLCYNLAIDYSKSPDYWNINIDVSTGEIINKQNFTIYCSHPDHEDSFSKDCSSNYEIKVNPSRSTVSSFMQSASYLVYPLPLGGPNEGEQSMATDQQFPAASPLGWHDINGVNPIFTNTRGNNVHAYEDQPNNNTSQNNEPDGRVDLNFFFPHNINGEPNENQDAAITNLFYTCNMSHDLFYLLGFTESSGNYQSNNFGLGGKENDHVKAEGLDGGDTNNANFSSPSDGNSGRLQMYVFNNTPGLLKIETPSNLSSLAFEIGRADFGLLLSSVDLQGELIIARSANQEEEFTACGDVINDVSGKIVLIDRGICDFSLKVFNAQQAGAIMAIVCNVAGVNGGTGEGIMEMGSGEKANDVTIPSVFMKKSDCDLLRVTLGKGVVELSVRERASEGPLFLNGSFDNTVVIHEYGHGVSTRLVGGPSNSSCLPDFHDNGDDFPDRGEQMGEGWSDFFSLAFTTKISDTREMPKGIGTYLTGSEPETAGFRTFPYSTDMSIDPLTYDDIKTSAVPHGVGTVWASMLWDLYWNFIDIYSFNPDWTDNTSGNFKALILIMDGMKLAPCRPGFTDTRDAILEADRINYDGIHEKMIWESFAKRGLGVNAFQGNTLDQRDGKEDFSIPPLLIEELKIKKEINNFVTPGEELDVKISIVNHIPALQSNVTIQDEISDGLSYVSGSSIIEPEIQGDLLIFNIGSLDYLQEFTLNYRLESELKISSTSLYLDDIENGDNGWTTQQVKGQNLWNISTIDPLSSEHSWYIKETADAETDMRLISPALSVTGNNPVLRFWHMYDMFPANNGGFVEISTDGGSKWNTIAEKFIIRNTYPGALSFAAFAIPALNGFSGSSGGKYLDSYIDLNDYKGVDCKFRFRYGNEGEFIANAANPGWFIDEVELLDLVTYMGTACVNSSEDSALRCTEIIETVVTTNSTTPTEDINIEDLFSVFPNPATNTIHISVPAGWENSNISIYGLDGRTYLQDNTSMHSNLTEIDVSELNTGMYLISIKSNEGYSNHKIYIQK